MMIQKLTTDPIIDEIHRTRREISDRFGGDFVAMLDDARRRQEASGRPVWQPNTTNKTIPRSGEVGPFDNG
jgi:hypothetical protein